MACPTIFEALRVATEHLGDEIYRFPYIDTFFEQYVTRGVFPKNKGVTMTTFTGGNSEPIVNAGNWHNISQTDGDNSNNGLFSNTATGLCNEPFVDVPVGFDENTYKPRRLSLAGPVICRDQLTFAHNPRKFFSEIYLPNLSKYTKRELDLEFRNQAMVLGTQLSVAAGYPEVAGGGVVTTMPALAAATGKLTQGTMDIVAARLIRAGATNAGGRTIELGPEGPIFPVVIGMEASKAISYNDALYRLSTQYAYMGKGAEAELLLRMGATKVVGNFRHKIELAPPRATHDGTRYVQVPTWEMIDSSEGKKARFTAAYNNAPYEAAIVPHPQQFVAEMVSPDTAGLDFDGTGFMGEWRFVTGGNNIAADNVCYDPLHKYGRHFAELFYAPKPIYPSFGYTIWYLRCADVVAPLITCSA